MARPLVILALVLFAIIGLASADANATPGDPASEAAAAAVPSFGPASDDQIGTSDDDNAHDVDAAVEAPVGGPVTPGAYAAGPDSSTSQSSGATVAEVSAVAAAVVAVASYFF